MSTYTKIAVRGAALVLVMSLVSGFLGYLVRVILARNLTIEEFGLFYSVFGFLGLFGIFKGLGFEKSMIKFIPEFTQKKELNSIKSGIIYTAIVHFITNSVIIIIVYIFGNFLSVSYFKSSEADFVLKLMALALFFDSFVEALRSVFQGFRRVDYYAGMDLIRAIMIVGIILIGFKLNYGILSPILAYAIVSVILLAVFGTILVRKTFREFFSSKFIASRQLLKKIYNYSIYVLFGGVGILIMGRIDIAMLTYFSGLTSVALYSVALPTTKVLAYIPQAIARVLLPLTSELWTKKEEKILKAGMEALYKYSIIVVLPLALMVFSFSDVILNIFFGKNYVAASTAMKILSIGMIFVPIGQTSFNFFLGVGKPQIPSKIVFGTSLFNFLSNLALIPILGIIGAAISTTLSNLVMMVTGLIKTRNFMKLELPIKIWAKTIISGLALVAVVYSLKNVLNFNIFLKLPVILTISFAAYIAMLFLLRVVDIKEVKDLYVRIVK